ncbi:MAG: S-methyl-5-thioribose-1-phosphate isomerase [Candidatus Riflebacteria bacterium]|nr:S-methyl-5-thioribose-1-phosphate isomerase [Candidatus Riflebacteria bacterium]
MIKTIFYNYELDTIHFVDQTLLPAKKEVVSTMDIEVIADAIRKLRVRGAPAIGIAASFGLFAAIRNYRGDEISFPKFLDEKCSFLSATRPTAVNLFWAINRSKKAISSAFSNAEAGKKVFSAKKTALEEAQKILDEDIEMCRKIGDYGAQFLSDGQSWLTHCNAGALATGGFGTALGLFRSAFESGKKFHVYIDETRPLLQGSRLTAWELLEEGIPSTLICDNMAAGLMAAGKIHGVVVGADRITNLGFVANKIGTYGVAVMAQYHKIPFYVAAPISTFDLKLTHGSEIQIEERNREEVAMIGPTMIAPKEAKVYNPAFDVTPPELVTAIITNFGVITPPYSENIKKIIGSKV